MIIAIDFDGTIVKHDYPNIGEPVPYALDVMRKMSEMGHELILLTMRGHKKVYVNNNTNIKPNDGRDTLQEAVDYLENNGIKLFGVNENPEQKSWTDSNKIHADMYIDDLNFGTPLIIDKEMGYFVDWLKVAAIFGIEF